MAPHSSLDIEVEGVRDTEGIAIPNPVTLQEIANRRIKAGKLVAGTAAFTTSDYFKKPSHGKPKARRWDHYISLESKSRIPSSLKAAALHLKKPGLISLGGGLPCPENFPFEEINIKVPQPPRFSEKETRESGQLLHAGKYDASEGKSVYDLSIALNYGLGSGSAQVIRFVTEHTEIVCKPPYEDWACALSVGSTSALEQTFRIFCERGDYILSEEYTFASAVETATPLGIKVLGVHFDDQGMLPESIDQVLSNWDAKARGARKPIILYTVPSGHNPTGATQLAERRREIYKVAQKHDLYIIEDEPYYFLQMQPYTGRDAPDPPPPANVEEFLNSLIPTYVSLDIDGRVMRMDSFSKVISPGTRVGWITASEQIVERFIRHNECSNQNPSGISQLILYKLLDEAWGHEGYFQWLINLRLEYTRRRNVLLAACEEFLPSDIIRWDPPAAGMFIWFTVDWHKHPKASTASLSTIEDEIFLGCVERGVLVGKGSWFIADRENFVQTKMYFRATFAAATEENITEAIRRFSIALKQSFGMI